MVLRVAMASRYAATAWSMLSQAPEQAPGLPLPAEKRFRGMDLLGGKNGLV